MIALGHTALGHTVLGHVGLLRPWWLLAMPVVGVLYGLSRPCGGALGGWEKAVDPHLLAAMTGRSTGPGGPRRAPALLLALLLGILALSGPAIQRASQNRLRNLDATLIVMDVSSDMDRSGAIREAASAVHDVLAHNGARQAGLIVYAGDAYVASALTDFTSAIDADLFALDDQTVPDPGVRPDRALALAGKVLGEARILNGDVVLVSGGGGLDGTGGIRAAAALAAAGHRVFAIDAAPGQGGDARGKALAALAAAGGGFSVPMLAPGRLLQALGDEAIRRTDSSVVNALDWRDYGRALLLLAAVPLLLGFRKAEAAS